MGVLGRFFGDRDHVPNNVAGMAALLGFVLIIVAFFVPAAVATKLLLIGGGLMSNALSYLFGRSSR